jgi:hypothetical protein
LKVVNHIKPLILARPARQAPELPTSNFEHWRIGERVLVVKLALNVEICRLPLNPEGDASCADEPEEAAAASTTPDVCD